MIIVDFSQVILANLMVQLGNHTNVDVDVSILRHMALNSIRLINAKFKAEYGQLVVACDDRGSWRKTIFPYYKANRKRDRDQSELDWTKIFDAISVIREEIKTNLPYRVLTVDGAEADDIIGTLVQEFGDDSGFGSSLQEKILIVSGDKDFQQLHRFKNVRQYDPTRKKFISCADPEAFLKEHIIRGDPGDGVPNILSQDNCFVIQQRQRPISSVKVEKWLDLDPKDFCDETMLRNYNRNAAMIDLFLVPDSIKASIMAQYNEQATKPRARIFNYLAENRLKILLQSIQDF